MAPTDETQDSARQTKKPRNRYRSWFFAPLYLYPLSLIVAAGLGPDVMGPRSILHPVLYVIVPCFIFSLGAVAAARCVFAFRSAIAKTLASMIFLVYLSAAGFFAFAMIAARLK